MSHEPDDLGLQQADVVIVLQRVDGEEPPHLSSSASIGLIPSISVCLFLLSPPLISQVCLFSRQVCSDHLTIRRDLRGAGGGGCVVVSQSYSPALGQISQRLMLCPQAGATGRGCGTERGAGSRPAAPRRSQTAWPCISTSSAWRGCARRPTCESSAQLGRPWEQCTDQERAVRQLPKRVGSGAASLLQRLWCPNCVSALYI